MTTARRVGLALLVGLCATACSKLWGLDYLYYDHTSDAGAGGVGAAGGNGANTPGGNGGDGGDGGGDAGHAGNPATELDCFDGLDDDGNELADCADPACQPVAVCLPAPLDGWHLGWLAPDALTDCPPGYETHELFDDADLVSLDAECACTCGTAQNVACYASVRCTTGTSCQGTQVFGHGARNICGTGPLGEGGGPDVSCSATAPAAEATSCPVQEDNELPVVTWLPAARLCWRPSGGACAEDAHWCMPRSPFPVAMACVVIEGAPASCPAAYPTAHVASRDGTTTEGRACSPCTCGNPTGGACSCDSPPCDIWLAEGGTCTPASVTFEAGGDCVAFAPTASELGVRISNDALDVVEPPTCAATPGTPTGAVTPDGSLTVCCQADDG